MKIAVLTKMFSITFFFFYSVRALHIFCQNRFPLVKARRWNCDFSLKGHFKNLTWDKVKDQGHGLIGKGHVAHQSIHIVDLNTSKVFSHRSSLSLLKCIAENLWVTFHDLKRLGKMRRGHWSQFSDSGCQVYLQPLTRCLRLLGMLFV